MSESNDRPRGILTPADRELLRGEVEYQHKQQYSNRRRQIRERIANGLLDFSFIQYLLQDRDRKRIFKEPTGEAGVEKSEFHQSIRAMFYWVYFGLKEQNYDFKRLLSEAIEQAEIDFARKYQGKRVDVRVRLDIDRTHGYDIKDLINSIEQGGPVQANRLYKLLELSGGVPIDTSELDSIRVWFDSSYIEGEKAVLETLFSEYLGAEVEVQDAIARVELPENGFEKESATIDPDYPGSDPSDIKNYRSLPDIDFDAVEADTDSVDDNTPNENEQRRKNQMTSFNGESEDLQPTIHQVAQEGEATRQEDPNPELILRLLGTVQDPFVSTMEVSAALGISTAATQQHLSELLDEGELNRRSTIDDRGERHFIWWLPNSE